jgi:hypothetical protein
MSRKFSRFLAVSETIFKHCKLPVLALGIAAPATLAALPSIALMSRGNVYFAAPPVLVRSGATNQAAKQPSIYEFVVRVSQNAGEPLKALKITQRPGADTITLDQSRIRAETVGEVRLSQAIDSQSTSQPSVSSHSLTKPPESLPSTLEGTELPSPNQGQRSGLDSQYSSYEAIRARATQPTYSGPTQPGATADSTSMRSESPAGSEANQNYRQLSESEVRAYRADSQIAPRAYVARQVETQDRQTLTLASIGGDDLVPGEAVVQFDPPVAPGTTVRVSIPAIANPQSGGTYLFGVTAFPAGENSSGQFLGYSQIRFYQN